VEPFLSFLPVFALYFVSSALSSAAFFFLASLLVFVLFIDLEVLDGADFNGSTAGVIASKPPCK
jgi:hypothetical protein